MIQTNGFANVNGTRLYYEITGVGEPLLFLHSGHLNSDMWEEHIEPFAKRYRVIRYDLRGHGRSKQAEGSVDDRQDLYELMRLLQIEQVHLVGSSYGGMTAIDFALDHPEMVRSLTLSCSSLSGWSSQEEDENTQGSRRAYEHLLRGEKEQAVDILIHLPMWRLGNPTAQERMKAMFAASAFSIWLHPERIIRPVHPAANRLSELAQPTLVLIGSRDNRISLEQADFMVRSIAGAQQAVFSDAGHLPNMENPLEFNRVVLDFLAQLDPSNEKEDWR